MKSGAMLCLSLGVCFLSIFNSSFGQKLSIDDLLNVYKLDSISLKTFCRERDFELVRIKEDNWMLSYEYQSATDKKISFHKTFPKDQSGDVTLYYYFDENKDYKYFKDSLKTKGFKEFGSHELFPPNDKNLSDYRERYVTPELEISLSTTNVGPNKRALLLYKRLNF
jgi:hypothetical protein